MSASEESKALQRKRDNDEWDRQTDLIQRPARMYADAIRQRDDAVGLLRLVLGVSDMVELEDLQDKILPLLDHIDGIEEAQP